MLTDDVAQKLTELKMNDFKINEIDQSKYETMQLCEVDKSCIGQRISIFGWVTASRTMKKFSFVDLTSHFKTVKCVIPTNTNINFQSSMRIYGVVKENAGTDKHLFEIAVEAYEFHNKMQAPSFPVNKESDKDTLLDNAHLALRMKNRSLFLEARSHMLRLFREFYWKHKYCEITPPTLVQTQVEGGSTLFSLDYYGEKAYLTQSSQLYLETVAPVAGKAFCIMPSYRAEKSRTSRHLSEFTHIEAELVDISFEQLMDQIESLVRYVANNFYKEMLDKIKEVDPDFVPFKFKEEKFMKITYKDAIEFFTKKSHLKTDGTKYEIGDDIADASERFLLEEYGKGQPVFLIRFPVEHKPFYVFKDEEGTQTCDLLFPGMGEIVGGSMRANVFQDLEDGFIREGIDPSPYYWYLDMSKYGSSQHGGYGLGFERLMLCLMKYKNVDQSCLYSRKPSRCTP
ncbi:asparagine--tRNA [Nucleospora cyclopteri]